MMEVRTHVLIAILGMALVTYLPRMLPLVVLSRFNLPPLLLRWLSFIPVAVLAALLAPDLASHQDYLIVALPTFLVAAITRSLMGTVVAGLVGMILLRLILP